MFRLQQTLHLVAIGHVEELAFVLAYAHIVEFPYRWDFVVFAFEEVVDVLHGVSVVQHGIEVDTLPEIVEVALPQQVDVAHHAVERRVAGLVHAIAVIEGVAVQTDK